MQVPKGCEAKEPLTSLWSTQIPMGQEQMLAPACVEGFETGGRREDGIRSQVSQRDGLRNRPLPLAERSLRADGQDVRDTWEDMAPFAKLPGWCRH